MSKNVGINQEKKYGREAECDQDFPCLKKKGFGGEAGVLLFREKVPNDATDDP